MTCAAIYIVVDPSKRYGVRVEIARAPAETIVAGPFDIGADKWTETIDAVEEAAYDYQCNASAAEWARGEAEALMQNEHGPPEPRDPWSGGFADNH